MIYAKCLVVRKVFPYTLSERYNEFDYDYDDEETGLELSGCEEPWVPLLRVCKAIHEEAEPMLYQQNTFVLPACDLTVRFFKRSLHNNVRRNWVKSVELSFDAGDMARYDREIVLDKHLEFTRDNLLFPEKAVDFDWTYSDGDDGEDFSDSLHAAYKRRLEKVVWPRKASYILDFLSLQELILDFRDSKCLEGCCRMRIQGIKAMDKGFAMGLPMRVKVLGIGDLSRLFKRVMAKWTAIRRSEVNNYDHIKDLDLLAEALGLELEDIVV